MSQYYFGTAPMEVNSCFCMGPQPGQTKCPCALRQERGSDMAFVAQAIIDAVTVERERCAALIESAPLGKAVPKWVLKELADRLRSGK